MYNSLYFKNMSNVYCHEYVILNIHNVTEQLLLSREFLGHNDDT